ncbi:ArgS-related anticodon-binding protein NrtL [Streptomyces celluloflavus]|uniref:ArgS-related anticodon-binding protein NrtL n=1 Tax=Streptomyces celluloflavus TaxID=58344 RepID=UPI0036BF8440
MTPAELSRTVLRSVRGAVEERELSVPVPVRIVVEPPPRAGCGDYASNVALQLAKPAGRPAREVAEILRKRLVGTAGITRVEIAGPGFLNFTLGEGASAALVRHVLAQGAAYGDRSVYGGEEDVAEVAFPGGGARRVVVAEALDRIVAAGGSGRPMRRGDVPGPGGGAEELAGLVARLGADEARWALLRPAAHDPVRLPERPVQRESNPRFRVQYAYARSRALVRNARELGFGSEPGEVFAGGDTAVSDRFVDVDVDVDTGCGVGPVAFVGVGRRPEPIPSAVGVERESPTGLVTATGSVRPAAGPTRSAVVTPSAATATAPGASEPSELATATSTAPHHPPQANGSCPANGSRPSDQERPSGGPPPAPQPPPPALQAHQTLHVLLAGYPAAVEAAARQLAPDRVVRQLEATADAFFRWHDVCPPLPVGEQKPLAVHRARLALVEATGTVLANGLRLLGISAPDHL